MKNGHLKKHLISISILIAYSALLIKVMVFKDVPLIRIGHLMLNFGGTAEGQANFVPFKTILPYLFGYKGLIIAGLNLIGNVALLVPLGFLVPLVYRKMTWKKSLALAIAAGLVIEVMQTLLRVGIFDIDDVILNAFGVMIGYSVFVILAKWVYERNYKNIIISAIIVIVAAASFYGAVVYPISHLPVNPEISVDGGDLCGGTGGTGQIVSQGNHTITIKRNDGVSQTINLTDRTEIRTSAGPASESDLKIGDHITVVIYDNKTATTILVCNATEKKV